jgi:hypothetical protein
LTLSGGSSRATACIGSASNGAPSLASVGEVPRSAPVISAQRGSERQPSCRPGTDRRDLPPLLGQSTRLWHRVAECSRAMVTAPSARRPAESADALAEIDRGPAMALSAPEDPAIRYTAGSMACGMLTGFFACPCAFGFKSVYDAD